MERIKSWVSKKFKCKRLTINELTVLSNLESHNAELIKKGKNKEERFEILSDICKYQLNILNNAEKIRLLNEKE